LIEELATDQPAPQRHFCPKVFRRPALLHLPFPIPVPVLVSSPEPRRTRLGFFDTAPESAASLELRLSRVLSVLSRRRVVRAEFRGVDARAAPDPAALSAALGAPVLLTDCGGDDATETATFLVRALPRRWSAERRREIEAALARAFEDAEVAVCAKCRCLFCRTDGSICSVRYHSGRRVAFPGGAWEEADKDGTLWNFSCCGVVGAGAEGCSTATYEQHVQQSGKSLSRFVVADARLFEDGSRLP
jgi:hypothetical protein